MKLSKPDRSWPDERLVAECLNGSQEAWSALVDKYSRLVYSLPVKYQLPPEEAADVFQGVWVDLHRDLARIEKVASLRSWLITAGSRRCLLHKRKLESLRAAVEVDSSFVDQRPGIAEIHESAEREQKLREALLRVPERCQRMLRMLFYEDPPRPYAEVARELGLAGGSIGFIRGRCLTKLRRALEELGF